MDTLAMMHQLKVSLWDLTYSYWKTETLFSLKWWILIVMNAIGYAIWWKVVDKNRFSQLLLFGSFVAVGRIMMDIIGTNTNLWSYDIREMPFFPSPFIHDFTITPLALMIVYQYSPSWKKFLAWTAVVTGGITFVLFPIFMAFNYLKYYHWNHIYSFIFVMLLATLSRAVLLGVLRMEQQYQCSKTSSSATLTCQPAMKPLGKENEHKDE